MCLSCHSHCVCTFAPPASAKLVRASAACCVLIAATHHRLDHCPDCPVSRGARKSCAVLARCVAHFQQGGIQRLCKRPHDPHGHKHLHLPNAAGPLQSVTCPPVVSCLRPWLHTAGLKHQLTASAVDRGLARGLLNAASCQGPADLALLSSPVRPASASSGQASSPRL